MRRRSPITMRTADAVCRYCRPFHPDRFQPSCPTFSRIHHIPRRDFPSTLPTSTTYQETVCLPAARALHRKL